LFPGQGKSGFARQVKALGLDKYFSYRCSGVAAVRGYTASLSELRSGEKLSLFVENGGGWTNILPSESSRLKLGDFI
jgi:hypothetical protein